jgi:hypothetical protein
MVAEVSRRLLSFPETKGRFMPRRRVHEEGPLSSTERVQRFRAQGPRRLEVLLDPTSFDQVSRFAQQWGCSRQEVLKLAWQACLPVMKQAATAQELFTRVRDALEAAGIE